MTVWFTSDAHIGHRLVAAARGFGDDVAAHDAELARRWDSVVGEQDTVWVLGDIAIGRGRAEREALAWFSRRRVAGHGRYLHLISGNHDRVHPSHRRAHRALKDFTPVFNTVSVSATVEIAGQRVLLNHLPYRGDHTAEDRFTQWRLPDEGRWLVHGHTHSATKQDGRMINVCPEAWDLTPVPMSEIEARIWDLAAP